MAAKKKIYDFDWALLLFLVGVTNVKLYIKVGSVVAYLLYVLYKKYPLKKPNKLNQFYLYILLLSFVGLVVNGGYGDTDYRFGFMLGIVQWSIALLASYLLYISIAIKSREEIVKVIKAFFRINAIVSIGTIVVITISLGFKIPYWAHSFKYGVSTGDYVNGILNDTSIVNAAINTLGIIYFLRTKEFRWALLCLVVMLLCTSNLTLLFFVVMAAFIVLFAKDKSIKRNTLYILLISVLAYPVLSPQNLRYITTVFQREAKQDYTIQLEKLPELDIKIKALEPSVIGEAVSEFGDFGGKDLASVTKAKGFYATSKTYDNPFLAPKEFSLNIDKYKAEIRNTQVGVDGEIVTLKNEEKLYEGEGHAVDPYLVQLAIDKWYVASGNKSLLDSYAMPGKLYAHFQTLYFLRSDVKRFFLGAGLGNFSSKLAIRMTGLGLQGNYPEGKTYINSHFLQYHFYTILYYLSKHAAEHSVLNLPNSTYNQLAGEYGVIGLLLFGLFYVGFLWGQRKKMMSGIFLSVLMLMMLGVEYWFEMLSLTIVFELLIFSELFPVIKNEQ